MLTTSSSQLQTAAGTAWKEGNAPYSRTSLRDVLDVGPIEEKEDQTPLRWADIIGGSHETRGAWAEASNDKGPSGTQLDLPAKFDGQRIGSTGQQASPKHPFKDAAEAQQSSHTVPQSPELRASLRKPTAKISLADFLHAPSTKRGSRNTPARDLQLSEQQMRNVRGLVKAYPNRSELAKAIRGRLAASGKKKLSPLKKLIMREKTNKAATAAAETVAAAKLALRDIGKRQESVQTNWQEANSRLAREKLNRQIPQPTLVTQVQVLEMAASEVGRRVVEAQRKLDKAEGELIKAEAARAKAWKTPQQQEPPQLQESQGNIETFATGQAKAFAESAPQARATLLAVQPVGPCIDLTDTKPVKVKQSKTASANLQVQPKVKRQPLVDVHMHEEEDEIGDEPIEGLQGFENVLADWIHDANEKALAVPAAYLSLQGQENKDKHTVEAEADEMSSEMDADGIGPEGWDDVLSAWIHNAGLLETPLTETEQPAYRGPKTERASRSASPSPTHSNAANVASNWQPELAARVSASARDVGAKPGPLEAPQVSVAEADKISSPGSMMSTTPGSTSYNSFLLASSSGSPHPFSMATHTSPAAAEHRLQDAHRRPQSQPPQPLLADVLAGGQLSQEALLDLRVSLADNLSMQSEDEEQAGVVSARVGGGGAVNLPAFPTRHSDAGALSSRPPPASRSLRSQHSWGLWPGSANANSTRWYDSGPSLPRLQSADHASLLSQQDLLMQAGAPEMHSHGVDLFGGRAANIGTLADLGLARLPHADISPQIPKMHHNALTAAQHQILDNLPATSPSPDSGMPSPLAHMPSVNSTTAHDGLHGSQSLPNWLQSHVSVNTQEVSPNLANQPRPAPRPHHVQQQFSGQMSNQMQPIFSSQWAQPSHLSQFSLEPSPFQAMPNPGPVDFQDSQGWVDPSLQNPFANSFTQTELSDPMRAARMSGMLHSPAYGLSQGFFPDSPSIPQHSPQLPPHNSYPQANLQELSSMNSSVDTHTLSNLYALRSLLSAESATSLYGEPLGHHPSSTSNWGDLAGFASLHGPQDAAAPISHDFHCDVCKVTCCGFMNFQQHCNSKKHLRRTASAGTAAIPESGSPKSGEEGDSPNLNPTYVGLQAQCRTYCKQVISTELNAVVVELLQQLLFWQERSKAINIHNAAKKKRLVSGLREVAKAIKLQKAKTVIVTPNIEQIETEGGLDDLLASILVQAEQSNCPVVFALSRKKLGQVFGCRKKMSAIAILDYAGAEKLFNAMEAHAEQGRRDWENHRMEREFGDKEAGGAAHETGITSGSGSPVVEEADQENQPMNVQHSLH